MILALDTQEACGAPRGSRTRNPKYVRVINPPWIDRKVVKRKTADLYVRDGQAVYVGTDLRMIESHPKFREAVAKAAQQKMTQDVEVDLRGTIYWNGSDTRPCAAHNPGESPIFPRPDSGRVRTEHPGETLTRMGMQLMTAPSEKNSGAAALQPPSSSGSRIGSPRQVQPPFCERG